MAANKTWTVFYNKKPLQGQINDGTTKLWTAVEAIAIDGKLKSEAGESIEVKGPINQFNAVEIFAETAEAAVVAARIRFGAGAQEGELTVIETAKLEKKPAR